MSRINLTSIAAVGLGALLAVGGQAVFSQVSTSQPAFRQRVEYLCVDQQFNHWSMHGLGQNFEGEAPEFAKKLGLKPGNPVEEGSQKKLTAEVLNKLAADGWELTASNTTALQHSFHASYIFRRGR